MPQQGPSRRRARKGAYHHGDLKAALIDAAAEVLQRKGLDALTIRAVAHRAGVSPAAPYRHFPDRRALLGAVAERGFARLQGAMLEEMRSVPAGDTGRAGLRQVAVAYVRFALANSAVYRVMFGAELANTEDLPELRKTARAVLGFVAEGIGRLQAAGLIRAGDAMLMATATWAMLHGLVMLSLDGQTAGVAPDVDSLVDEATRMMMFGMTAGDRPQ